MFKKAVKTIWEKVPTDIFIVAMGIISLMIAAAMCFGIPAIAAENKPHYYEEIEVIDTIYLNNGGVYVVVDDEDYAGVIQTEYWQYKLCEPGSRITVKVEGGKVEITSILPPATTTWKTVN